MCVWGCQAGLILLLCHVDGVTRATMTRGLERGCVVQSSERPSPVPGMQLECYGCSKHGCDPDGGWYVASHSPNFQE